MAVFAAGTALDALITYVALKSFPGHLEEGNCLLARLIDATGLEWALVVWLAVNVAALPLLNFFWERRPVRYFVYIATIMRVGAVIHNLNIINDLLALAARLS